MKKMLLFVIVLLISSNSFCQTVVCDATFNPTPATRYGKYSNLIPISQAVIMEQNYINNTLSQIDKNIGYFVFDAGTLFNYIYDMNKNSATQLQDIDFILKRDKFGYLTMMVTGMDVNNNNIYSKGNFLLPQYAGSSLDPKKEPFESLKDNTINNPPVGDVQVCTLFFLKPEKAPNLVPIGMLQQTLDDYVPTDNEPTVSFIFNAGSLANFIANTAGIQNVAVILARDGILRLLIVGVDNGNPTPLTCKPLYNKDGAGLNYVLEHCFPCPSECPNVSLESVSDITLMSNFELQLKESKIHVPKAKSKVKIK